MSNRFQSIDLQSIVSLIGSRFMSEYYTLGRIDVFKLGFNNAKGKSLSIEDRPELPKSLRNIPWSELKQSYEAGWQAYESGESHWLKPLFKHMT